MPTDPPLDFDSFFGKTEPRVPGVISSVTVVPIEGPRGDEGPPSGGTGDCCCPLYIDGGSSEEDTGFCYLDGGTAGSNF